MKKNEKILKLFLRPNLAHAKHKMKKFKIYSRRPKSDLEIVLLFSKKNLVKIIFWRYDFGFKSQNFIKKNSHFWKTDEAGGP